MENVLLTILLINALLLIGIVLLQRSEGGGLGMGGGGVMTGRSAATALAKLTWLFGAAFMACSLALTVVAARNASDAD
jgi:preprotein translocase subunit SecG